ncbi:MAG: (2Fe-2S) ferredoxin domain-containing protein [Vampirovibrionales bacterium]|nr:(2Fe-2S) ferredoxin domain-containing protein [Vampirovibrionales bacterium]
MTPETPVIKALESLAPVTTAKLAHHVFVCTGTSCSNRESQATLETFWEVLKGLGLLYGKRGSLDGSVMVTTCGSVGLCSVGPAVLIYPEGVWYHGVSAADVPELVQSHFILKKPLERLLAKAF